MDEENGPFEEDIDVDDPTFEHSSTRTNSVTKIFANSKKYFAKSTNNVMLLVGLQT